MNSNIFKIYSLSLAMLTGGLISNASVLDNVDTTIGGISHICVPTFQMVHRPNAMLRFNVNRFAGLQEYTISSFPLCLSSHRDQQMFAILPFDENPKGTYGKHYYDAEYAKPYRYDVYLNDSNATLAFAPAERGGIFEFVHENEKSSKKGFTISTAYGTLTAENNIIKGYDVVRGSRNYKRCPERDIKLWIYGEAENAMFSSDAKEQKIINAYATNKKTSFKYALSYISQEQAKANFIAQVKGKDLDDLAEETKDAWENVLERIEVKGGTEAQRRIFYTSLYRCHERMVNFSEDGWYMGYDYKPHKETQFRYHNDDWLWDTYRTLHPLMCILDPATEVERLRSYIRMYEESGYMPTFPAINGDGRKMIVNHHASIFLDAYQKGLRGFDLKKAFEGISKTILERSIIPWYDGAPTVLDEFYSKNGYFPAITPDEKETVEGVHRPWEKRQSVSVTLGESFDDWCAMNIAEIVGDKEKAELFAKRASNYKNLFNPKTKFFAPKDEKGNFINIDPNLLKEGSRPYYTENNAYTYRWEVPHNIADMISMYGGAKEFEKCLDALFVTPIGTSKFNYYHSHPDSTGLVGQFVSGNEPSFNIPYLFVYSGSPWKTQKILDFICNRWFRDDYMGVPGDEDGGAMCAFYVFTSMGFYPVTTGLPMYVIGTPMFEKVVINLPNGKKFKIIANDRTPDNKYIQSAKLNGKPLNRAWFTHEELVNGGVLEFEMGNRPNKEWATSPDAVPPSYKM